MFFWILAGLYVLGWAAAPFPHWPSYFYLWKVLLRSPWNRAAKARLAWFLARTALVAPLFSLFWYLDELLYRDYRSFRIKPVFIVGQPRCGTTFLHRTLSNDSDTFFAVQHIEWRFPSISLQKLITVSGLRPYLLRASYWPRTRHGELAAKMHPNRLADPEEDGIFFEENYLHHFFMFLRFPDVELLRKLSAFGELPEATQRRMLDAHRRCIQKVAYLRGGAARLYLSKEVTSHNKVQALIELYPDARFLVTVRSAENFLPSLLALMQTSTLSKTGLNTDDVPGWKDAVIAHFRAQSELLVKLCEQVIEPDRQLHIPANVMVQEVVASVSRIYEFLGMELGESFLCQLREIEAQQHSRSSGYSYEELETTGFSRFERFARQIEESFERGLSPSVSAECLNVASNRRASDSAL